MIASRSGPIRVASSRAGITTLIDWRGVIVGRTGGAVFAALARRLRAMAPAATRATIETIRRSRRIELTVPELIVPELIVTGRR
jgi:hypothetical protein